MICYVLAMGKQHLRPHVVVGYGIKIFWPGLFITSPDHLAWVSKLHIDIFFYIFYMTLNNLSLYYPRKSSSLK